MRGARASAMWRGLAFLERFAFEPAWWRTFAPEFEYLFFHFATRPIASPLTVRARDLALRAARRWCRENPRLPADARPTDLLWWYAYGVYTPTRLGLDTRAIRAELARALRACSPRDLLWFDPRREPPPSELYDTCRCGTDDRAGPSCAGCGARRVRLDRYDAWMSALVGTHLAEELGLDIGASVEDAVSWRGAMLPYPSLERRMSAHGHRAFYAVTHLVYVLDDYGASRLPRAAFAPELAFVRAACEQALDLRDVEILGESIDVLLALDEPASDPLVTAARALLLALQNADGSWGRASDDVYSRFHKTWVALDGLMSYAPRPVAPVPAALATAPPPGRSAR